MEAEGPVVARYGRQPVRLMRSLGWLAVTTFVIAVPLPTAGLSWQVAGGLLCLGAGAGWTLLVGHAWAERPGWKVAGSALLAGCGGALVALTPVALAFVAVSGLLSAEFAEPLPSLGVTALAMAAAAASLIATAGSVGFIAGAAAAGLAGVVLGGLRRFERVSGLADSRLAIRALRDEPFELVGEIAKLADGAGAELEVTGQPRPLPAQAGVALYRTVQEAITNAAKHAPGAPVAIQLSFGAERIRVRVRNGAPNGSSRLASTGGGFGLAGIRERCRTGPRPWN